MLAEGCHKVVLILLSDNDDIKHNPMKPGAKSKMKM